MSDTETPGRQDGTFRLVDYNFLRKYAAMRMSTLPYIQNPFPNRISLENTSKASISTSLDKLIQPLCHHGQKHVPARRLQTAAHAGRGATLKERHTRPDGVRMVL